MRMKFFAIGLALILPVWVLSQSTPQKPTTQQPATQKPATQQSTTQKPATQPATTQKPAGQQTTPARPTPQSAVTPKPTGTGTQQTAAQRDAAQPTRAATEAQLTAEERVAADADRIHFRLEDPEREGGRPYRDLLREHVSSRRFSEQELEPRHLSTLLWGLTCKKLEDGADETSGTQTLRVLDVYVVMKEGVFLYNPKEHVLQGVINKDVRKRMLNTESMLAEHAPVFLVYVANAKKQAQLPINKKDFYTAMDCGIASQIVSLFCASENLVTTTIDVDPIATGKVLELKGGDKVVLVQPVGFR